jgi:NAD-dependent SIR2 family protein deacetylase
MVPIAARRGAPIVIVNGQETAMDEFGEAVVTGSISEVLPPIVGWVGD